LIIRCSIKASRPKVPLAKVPSKILLLSAVVGRGGVKQADDSDLLDLDMLRVFQLHLDVFEYEGPHVVAEPICIEMAL
jgi:hypothetical protein